MKRGSQLMANRKSGDRSMPAVKQYNLRAAMRAGTLKMSDVRIISGQEKVLPPGKSAQNPSFYY